MENRITGWTDGVLTGRGVEEAKRGGGLVKEGGFVFDCGYTLVLKRAIKTLWLALERMDLMWIPVHHSWRLNERHYGALQGLDKAEMAAKFGEEQVLLWRRSYDVPPPALERGDPRHPRGDPRYSGLAGPELPLTESLKDTVARFLPHWRDTIAPKLPDSEESRTEAREGLRESERAISEANRALRALADRRAVAQTQLAALTRRARELEDEIASRRESLGRLLTSRYLDGEQSALKLLFSGEDPRRIARELYYYGHVSRDQAEFIGELGSSLEQLRKLEAGGREKSAEPAAIESAARKERSVLLKEQAEHRRVLERVSVQLREQRREVKQ